jgi:Na+-driven multidrug efflux pump
MGTTLFQATGKAYQTFLLSISRQILFLIPLIMLLPNFFQLTGVWISFPIADIMAAMLTFLMIIKYKHYFKASAIRLKTKR